MEANTTKHAKNDECNFETLAIGRLVEIWDTIAFSTLSSSGSSFHNFGRRRSRVLISSGQ